ncbi:hypothetical protein [Stomatobaculum longum]|uniref:hypothetical protein n=1 Tax=Stomatobaculum longum TaxID=796942 RepID=UPI0028E4AED4|nr:hypothetical protein [Stomatobaculum longum]
MIKLETNRRSIRERGVQLNDKFKERSHLRAQFPNRYKIICKGCAFRDKSTITIHGKVIPVGVTKAFCDKYRKPPHSNGKPHDVLFNEAICEYYEEEKQ